VIRALVFAPMRIAILYDCLYPHTIGGAERWYRALAERLERSNEVTYVTRLQWPRGSDPGTSFPVVTVMGASPLYAPSGRRRIWPPLRYGIGVFWHLLRHGGRYAVVHSDAFPYFSLIGAWLALKLRRRGSALVVDWFEVWSRDYWIQYLGPVGGRVGHAVQRLCTRLPDRSFVFSKLHEQRLRDEGHRAPLTRLTGIYSGGSVDAETTAALPPTVVFAGRHIPEKGVLLVPPAMERARVELPELRCVVYGDGPETEELRERVAALGLGEVVELAGRVDAEVVERAIEHAACLLLPSIREGYGLVVVEAVAHSTPAVVVAGPENAAVELIDPGVNGFVAGSADPEAIAAGIVEAVQAGDALRHSTLEWYRSHRDQLSIESSFAAVERAYQDNARS
jgi:glycosyltransferase involved in cell wall biosynthesis